MEDKLLSNIESGIKKLINAYKTNPYNYYSGSDLHSALFHILATKGVNQSCVTRLGRSRTQSTLLHREYPARARARKYGSYGADKR